jgi:hypothetical protein
MDKHTRTKGGTDATAMESIRRRIENGGERIWRMENFGDLPPAAAAQALSRLTKTGLIQRISKGTYYRGRNSTFGKTRPNPNTIGKIAALTRSIFPAGVTAANQLGFTTQAPSRAEISTSAGSIPKKLIGDDAIVHTHRPDAWNALTTDEAALLEFMRRGGRDSELSPEDTLMRLRNLISKTKLFKKLLKAAPSEPPRVRAIIGALGEEIGAERKELAALHRSLNPLSKFDFGIFSALPNAKHWQAKEASR